MMHNVLRRILPLTALLLGLLAGGCAASGASDSVATGSGATATPSTVTPPPSTVPATTAPATAVAPTSPDDDTRAAEQPPTPEATAPPKATALPDPTATAEPNPFRDLVQPLAAAPIGSNVSLAPIPGPVPIGLHVAAIGVSDAPVVRVGVNPDRTFEVPAREEVGWYEFGVSPGEAGSAVLAAHIAFDGVDGVFRNLEDLSPGDVVEIRFDNGMTRSFAIESVTEYNKQALPDSLFARDGREQIALITCGGPFNRQLNSYESNTVAVAVPVT